MSSLVITVPADVADWGPVEAAAPGTCQQRCSVFSGGELVCTVTLHWPKPQPFLPVVAVVDGRHGGPQD